MTEFRLIISNDLVDDYDYFLKMGVGALNCYVAIMGPHNVLERYISKVIPHLEVTTKLSRRRIALYSMRYRESNPSPFSIPSKPA